MSLRSKLPRLGSPLIYTSFLLACLLAGAAPVHGQEQQPCRPDGKRGDGDDVKCRIERLLDKQQIFLEKTKNRIDARCAQGAQCDRLKKTIEKAEARRARAASSNNRATPDDYKELIVKGKGKRRGGGGGGGGGGANTEMTTQEQEEEGEEPQVDPAIGEDIANDLDEAIEAIDDANQTLDSEVESESAAIALAQASDKFQPTYTFGRSDRTSPGIAYTAFIVFRVSHTLAEVTDKYCKQTAVAFGFGGNASAFCAVVFAAAQVFENVKETIDFLDDDIDSAEIEGAFERAGQVYDVVTALQVSTNAIQNSTTDTGAQIEILRSALTSHDDDIKALLAEIRSDVRENQQQVRKVIAVQRQIIELLLVPEGRRVVDPRVLTCTGDNCPVVLNCPGTECSFPIPR